MSDLRQGVSEATHAVLDRVDALAGSTEFSTAPAEYFLRLAERAAAAAVRADPRTGNGRRRVDRAREAAALLLLALNRMGEDGREVAR